jgi:hypothetical protein
MPRSGRTGGGYYTGLPARPLARAAIWHIHVNEHKLWEHSQSNCVNGTFVNGKKTNNSLNSNAFAEPFSCHTSNTWPDFADLSDNSLPIDGVNTVPRRPDENRITTGSSRRGPVADRRSARDVHALDLLLLAGCVPRYTDIRGMPALPNSRSGVKCKVEPNQAFRRRHTTPCSELPN